MQLTAPHPQTWPHPSVPFETFHSENIISCLPPFHAFHCIWKHCVGDIWHCGKTFCLHSPRERGYSGEWKPHRKPGICLTVSSSHLSLLFAFGRSHSARQVVIIITGCWLQDDRPPSPFACLVAFPVCPLFLYMPYLCLGGQ